MNQLVAGENSCSDLRGGNHEFLGEVKLRLPRVEKTIRKK